MAERLGAGRLSAALLTPASFPAARPRRKLARG